MPHKVKWRQKAEDRLLEIAEYIAAENPAAADKLMDLLELKAEQLKTFPNRGRPGKLPGTRELLVPPSNFKLVYRVSTGLVEILGVLHTRQKWPPSTDRSDYGD